MLQNTLVEVEASSGVTPDDPALLALKSVVLRRIAHLELANAEVTEETIAPPPSVAVAPRGVEGGQAVPAVPPANGGDGPPMAVVSPPNEVAPAVAAALPANEAASARLEISPQEPKQETTSGDGANSAGPASPSPKQTDPGQKPS